MKKSPLTFQHSFIKNKIPVFECNAKIYILFPKIKEEKILTKDL